MATTDSIRIKYASKFAASANYWKFYIGQTKGLERLNIVEKKKTTEQEFVKWVNADDSRKLKYGGCIDSIHEAYDVIRKYSIQNTYFMEAALSGMIMMYSYSFEKLLIYLQTKAWSKNINDEATSLKDNIDGFFKTITNYR